MWIRSQDKEELVNVQRFSAYGGKVVAVNLENDGDYITLGRYETNLRAIEVLDEIQHQLINVSSSESVYDDGQTINHYEVVYEMPKE